MQRKTINRKPDLILTSDWHLREDTPTCFTGDWEKEQWTAIIAIQLLQSKYQCPVIIAGDVFHHWKPSPSLLSKTIQHAPNNCHVIFGQHDLPQHNLDLAVKSGLWTLIEAHKFHIMHGWHYGQTPDIGEGGMLGPSGRIICVWHHLTYITKPFPNASGGMAEGILRKYPKFDLIVTGDNHTSFTIEYKGRRLVNPGNLTRQTADQINYKPRVALWYAEDNSIQWVNLPIQNDVITREYIDRKEQRDKRIEAFVSQLSEDWEKGVSFEQNLKSFQKTNNVDEDVMKIIYKAIEQ